MSSYEPRDSINSTLLGFCILEIFNSTMTKDLFKNEKKNSNAPWVSF